MTNISGSGTGPAEGGLNRTLLRNIERFDQRQQEADRAATLSDRLSAAITDFSGSMRFVLIHAVYFGGWIAANIGLVPGLTPFDPSLVILAMLASVEAIFLSTFVLIAQNRMAAAADRRADLDLHVSLLAEAELTRLAELTAQIARRLDVPVTDPEFHEVTRLVDPTEVLDELERRGAD